ncbi:hypothetical protein BASA81_014017 [Batrachochytrium salamandrivorans]|nr:hypothetical protein BASA81_014017 [Batrachochytrium salamandrivorans]
MAAAGTPLAELFAKHRQDIDTVLTKLHSFIHAHPEYDAVFTKDFVLDELLVTKYLLSSPKRLKKPTDTLAEVAYTALVATLQFRLDNHQLFTRIASLDMITVLNEGYFPMFVGGYLGSELVVVSDFGAIDLREISKQYDTAVDMAQRGLASSEKIRAFLDLESHKTGKLVKMINVNNLTGISLMRISSPKALQGLGMVSAWNDEHNPQLMSRVCMVNTPMLVSTMIKMAKPFFSKSTMDKIALCKQSGSKKGQTLTSCPFLAKFGSEVANQLPQSLGGVL